MEENRIALLGIITPSILIISVLSLGFFPLLQNPKAIHVINGILLAVLVLLLPMVLKMIKKNNSEKISVFIALIAAIIAINISQDH